MLELCLKTFGEELSLCNKFIIQVHDTFIKNTCIERIVNLCQREAELNKMQILAAEMVEIASARLWTSKCSLSTFLFITDI